MLVRMALDKSDGRDAWLEMEWSARSDSDIEWSVRFKVGAACQSSALGFLSLEQVQTFLDQLTTVRRGTEGWAALADYDGSIRLNLSLDKAIGGICSVECKWDMLDERGDKCGTATAAIRDVFIEEVSVHKMIAFMRQLLKVARDEE